MQSRIISENPKLSYGMQSQCSVGFIGNIAVRLMFVLLIGILVSMRSAAVALFGLRYIHIYF